MMQYLLYSSDSVFDAFDHSDLRILREAMAFNARHGVSGFLLREGRCFVQYLEGPPAAVDLVMARIRQDRRHSELRIEACGTCAHRGFDGWSMGYAPDANHTLAQALGCRSLRAAPLPLGPSWRYLQDRARAQEAVLRKNAL